MKIFEIKWTKQDEKEWVVAYTNIEALQKYCSITDMDISEFDACDEIIEIPKSKWGKYTVKMDDEQTITFKEWMKLYSKYGPDIIAGTMYEI